MAAAVIVRDHRTAIEYDLLTKAGRTLADVGGGISWETLFAFIRHLPADSAYWRELQPEAAAWIAGDKTAALLADLFDLVAAKGARRQPKPYPRPKLKGGGERFGADPIPISEFDAWYYRKD